MISADDIRAAIREEGHTVQLIVRFKDLDHGRNPAVHASILGALDDLFLILRDAEANVFAVDNVVMCVGRSLGAQTHQQDIERGNRLVQELLNDQQERIQARGAHVVGYMGTGGAFFVPQLQVLVAPGTDPDLLYRAVQGLIRVHEAGGPVDRQWFLEARERLNSGGGISEAVNDLFQMTFN